MVWDGGVKIEGEMRVRADESGMRKKKSLLNPGMVNASCLREWV